MQSTLGGGGLKTDNLVFLIIVTVASIVIIGSIGKVFIHVVLTSAFYK